MPADPAARDHDIVIFGATGFTGELTAAYLAEHAPMGLRWALAGRNQDKLEKVRSRLATIDPALAELPLLRADSSDAESLRAVAESTRVVITTVGPYLLHGEPLVAACAEAGTDYLDLTGEPEFVDQMFLKHHDRAVETGARIVHAAGFDSIPHDLGAWFTVQELGSSDPITLRGVVRAGGMASGGTFHSAMEAMSRPKQMREAMVARRRKENRPVGRKARAVSGKPHRDRVLGLWLLPLPTIDPFVVARSGAALPSYGPDFRYSHYAGLKTLRYTVGGVLAVGGLAVSAQVPPLRNFLKSRIKQGDGPSKSAPRQVVVHRRLRGRERRPHRAHARLRRRPGLRRDREDARRVGAVPGARRQPADLGAGHHRLRDGREPAHPPAEGRHLLRRGRLGRGGLPGRPARVSCPVRASGSW